MTRQPTGFAQQPEAAAERERARALTRMKRLATALLAVMAVIFAISFALRDRYPWLEYVRAASEGGMVGAIADWFAVTALFRHPFGVPIPHTAIIPRRKNEIGASLGEFVEVNFLSEPVVRTRLASFSVSSRLGSWLADPERARRLTAEAATAAGGILTLLSDDDVRDVIESIARTQLVEPVWGPPIGRVGERILAAGHQQTVLNIALDRTDEWLHAHPGVFRAVVSGRLPAWVPSVVNRLVDDSVYRQSLRFVAEVRADPEHPARELFDRYLADLADELQHDQSAIDRLEAVKATVLDDPRVTELASRTWDAVKARLGAALAEPDGQLRNRFEAAVIDLGRRLARDRLLAAKIDGWVADAAGYVVRNYRHEIVSVITDTVERWDPIETTQKIESMVGKDLQFIRINGTVVGALAGLAIYSVATLLVGGAA
ncbi:MAG: DUF445 domain-containing protein [Microbacteriaceae bacterium]